MFAVPVSIQTARCTIRSIIACSMHDSAETLMPVPLRILRAEHRRDSVVAALEEHATQLLTGFVEEPLVDHAELERTMDVEHPDSLTRSSFCPGVLTDRPTLSIPKSHECACANFALIFRAIRITLSAACVSDTLQKEPGVLALACGWLLLNEKNALPRGVLLNRNIGAA